MTRPSAHSAAPVENIAGRILHGAHLVLVSILVGGASPPPKSKDGPTCVHAASPASNVLLQVAADEEGCQKQHLKSHHMPL